MKAIVLAAGKGTRLLPLTSNRPKHLLEIGGKPILKWLIDDLIDTGIIDEIIIVVNYKSELIIEEVETWYDENNITFIHQEEPLGTGDAVASALKSTVIDKPFLVANGDVLINETITSFLDQYKSSSSDGAILGAHVDEPRRYGVLNLSDGNLLGIIEKPDSAEANSLINAGLYIFPAESKEIFFDLPFSERGEKELTDALTLLISEGKSIKVIETNEKWMDVGYPWHLLEANEYLLKKYSHTFQQLGTIEKGAHLIGDVHVAKTARVRSGVYIEGPVFIDENADIGPNCYIRASSYLGKKSRVGNGCEIKNSILYKDSHAAHLSYVGDSIIGEHSNLGAGTITANLRHDGGNIRVNIKDKRVNTGRRKLGVIMGDKVKTGISVQFLPGVKIKSNKWLNAGEVVVRDK
jgi:bifunctional UDP-N-acetylglucosamine pyrophosphorylase/glucosamine-1-phosphate N-acetyltransferase